MPIAFAQSLRSLQQDRHRFSLVWLLIVNLIFVTWLLWFFLASLTFYAHGQIVKSSSGIIVAEFPAATQPPIRLGQAARLYAQPVGADSSDLIPATVTEVDDRIRNGQIQVTLYADMDSPHAAALQTGLTGQVEIAIDKISPAALVLRGARNEE